MVNRAFTVVERLAPLLLSGAGFACENDWVEPDAFSRSDGERGVAETGPSLVDATPPVRSDAGDAGAPTDVRGELPMSPTVQDPECNLNGRWLVAQRVLATALNEDQASHNWFYLDVRHEGAAVRILRGLHCGFEVVPKTNLAAAVDSSRAWPSFLTHDSSAGRTGTFVKVGNSCHLALNKEYVVRGATVAYYADPTTTLPNANQQASGSTPGWEDWDNDGNPGISLQVRSPLASGTLYVAQRDWTIYDGTTALQPAKFKVSITFGTEQSALGRSAGSSQTLETTASPSSDASQHYAWFHTLDSTQATGSDEDICAAVRSLKDTLVAEAGQ
jgi:hypothetical protein